ncbi:hypothetical protein PoB_007410800 [Plakobranchus ocellatus]|uniref:Uncharacterized protein n=1 Tax=Plakobranchus ocellatus TaxID=259542 RepID=A0AAV4DU25_9GAST|nr:hypothetical protein PoB_007410800 [Plakobranchus ocellatus]
MLDSQVNGSEISLLKCSVSMVSKLYKPELQGSAPLCPWSASFINQGYKVQLLWVHGQLYKPGLQGSVSVSMVSFINQGYKVQLLCVHGQQAL